MTLAQFEIAARQLATHFARSNADMADLSIIGGEPTLLPASYYQKAIPMLRRAFDGTGKKYQISIVTNLLHYKNLLPCLAQFDLVVTSYEPSRFSTENGKQGAQYKAPVWFDNLNRLITMGVDVGLSLATAKDVIEKGTPLLDQFVSVGVQFFQINLVVPDGKLLKNELGESFYTDYVSHRSDLSDLPRHQRPRLEIPHTIIPNFQHEAEYFIDVTEWLYTQRMKAANVDVYPIASYLRQTQLRTLSDDVACGVERGLNVRPDGIVSGCASEMGSWTPLSYGNIFLDDIQAIIDSPRQCQHQNLNNRAHRTCLVCPHYLYCQGGCALRSRLWDEHDTSSVCHGLSPFLDYLQQHADRLTPVLLHHRS